MRGRDDSILPNQTHNATMRRVAPIIDVPTLGVFDRFEVSSETYSQAVAVAPEIVTALVFANGFETGDTRAW